MKEYYNEQNKLFSVENAYNLTSIKNIKDSSKNEINRLEVNNEWFYT